MARRKRNRKKQVQGFILPVPFTGIIVALFALALGYVRLGTDSERLGKELKALESESRNLSRRILTEEYHWSRMNSAANIERALLRHNIVMGRPREDQIVRIILGDEPDRVRAAVSSANPLEGPLLAQVVLNE